MSGIERLEALLTAAAALPWTMDQPFAGFSGFRSADEPVFFTAAPLKEVPRAWENHEAVLELMNAAPTLLAIARIASETAAFSSRCNARPCGLCDMCALRAQLAKLEAFDKPE